MRIKLIASHFLFTYASLHAASTYLCNPQKDLSALDSKSALVEVILQAQEKIFEDVEETDIPEFEHIRSLTTQIHKLYQKSEAPRSKVNFQEIAALEVRVQMTLRWSTSFYNSIRTDSNTPCIALISNAAKTLLPDTFEIPSYTQETSNNLEKAIRNISDTPVLEPIKTTFSKLAQEFRATGFLSGTVNRGFGDSQLVYENTAPTIAKFEILFPHLGEIEADDSSTPKVLSQHIVTATGIVRFYKRITETDALVAKAKSNLSLPELHARIILTCDLLLLRTKDDPSLITDLSRLREAVIQLNDLYSLIHEKHKQDPVPLLQKLKMQEGYDLASPLRGPMRQHATEVTRLLNDLLSRHPSDKTDTGYREKLVEIQENYPKAVKFYLESIGPIHEAYIEEFMSKLKK